MYAFLLIALLKKLRKRSFSLIIRRKRNYYYQSNQIYFIKSVELFYFSAQVSIKRFVFFYRKKKNLNYITIMEFAALSVFHLVKKIYIT